MNHIKKITFLEIKKTLIEKNIFVESEIEDSEIFQGINSILNANSNEITFLNNNNQKKGIAKSLAKACIVNKKSKYLLPKNCKPILVDDTYKSFALISNLFNLKRVSNGKISELSFVDKNSQIGNNVEINSFSNISENCEIDNEVIIDSNCNIGPNVKIGKKTIIHSNCSLFNCNIGSNCIIKSGAVIGGQGFGFDPKSKIKIEHYGDVVIKDNCYIGSNTTIDRAVFESTLIDENSHIDNLVQIAHNVKIGKHAIIAAQTGIAGSTIIDDFVMIGGQAGIAGHLKIGKNVTIAAKSGVTKNLNNNSVVGGFPAMDIKKWKLSIIKLNKLNET